MTNSNSTKAEVLYNEALAHARLRITNGSISKRDIGAMTGYRRSLFTDATISLEAIPFGSVPDEYYYQ